MYEAENAQPSCSTAPAADMYQTHAPRMYGALSFKRRRTGENVESQDEGRDENGEQPLLVDETVDTSEGIFPCGERPFSLGDKGRFAVVQLLRCGVFVSLREYFQRSNPDGILQWYPTKKGIHLRAAEWREFVDKIHDIDAAVRETTRTAKLQKLEDRSVKTKRNVLPHPSDRPTRRITPTPAPTDN